MKEQRLGKAGRVKEMSTVRIMREGAGVHGQGVGGIRMYNHLYMSI